MLIGGGLIRSMGGVSPIKAIRATGMHVMRDERIFESSDFVESVLKRADEAYEKATLIRAKGVNLEKIQL